MLTITYQQVKWHTHTLWQFGGQSSKPNYGRWPNSWKSPLLLPTCEIILSLITLWNCCCSVTQLRLTLCDTMDCSTSVLYYPCPLLSPWVYSNSCPLNQWCHPAISSSVSPFCCCSQLFPALRSFPVFASGDQNTGASALASVLPMSTQGWFLLRLTGMISLLSKGLSGVFSSTTVLNCQFFSALPSLWSSSHSHIWLLGRP